MRQRLAVLLMLTLLLSACASNPRPKVSPVGGDGGTEVKTTITEPTPITEQMAGRTGIQVLVITDGGFEPAVVRVGVNQRVKWHVINRGQKEHNLILPRYGVVVSNIAPGAENYVEFTAGEKGDWPFFSDSPGAQEFAGSLKVE